MGTTSYNASCAHTNILGYHKFDFAVTVSSTNPAYCTQVQVSYSFCGTTSLATVPINTGQTLWVPACNSSGTFNLTVSFVSLVNASLVNFYTVPILVVDREFVLNTFLF